MQNVLIAINNLVHDACVITGDSTVVVVAVAFEDFGDHRQFDAHGVGQRGFGGGGDFGPWLNRVRERWSDEYCHGVCAQPSVLGLYAGVEGGTCCAGCRDTARATGRDGCAGIGGVGCDGCSDYTVPFLYGDRSYGGREREGPCCGGNEGGHDVSLDWDTTSIWEVPPALFCGQPRRLL